jgi:hypothetical protein
MATHGESFGITFTPCYLSLDSPFNLKNLLLECGREYFLYADI